MVNGNVYIMRKVHSLLMKNDVECLRIKSGKYFQIK